MDVICIRSLFDRQFEVAFSFCTKAHTGQYRRYSNQPYWVHPLEVANLVWQHTNDKTLTVAALLHDVIEDTTVSEDDICEHFGNTVAKLVAELSTDSSLKGTIPRSERKARAMQQVLAASPEAQIIKRADIISNCRGVSRQSPTFAAYYLPEKQRLLNQLPCDGSMLDQLARSVVAYEIAQLDSGILADI